MENYSKLNKLCLEIRKNIPEHLTKEEICNESIEENDNKGKTTSNKKNKLKNSEGSENQSNYQSNQCEKCSIIKDSMIKTINQINSYVETLNEKMNNIYNKTSISNKKNSENENLMSFEYYHSMYFSDFDKLKCGSEITNQVKQLLKNVKFFSNKVEYIIQKQDYYEKLVEDFRNIRLSNAQEVYYSLVKDFSKINKELESKVEASNDLKEVKVQDIFKKFNNSKENLDNVLKDLKQILGIESKQPETIIVNESLEFTNDLKNDFNKEIFLKNELSRLQKENLSIKMELNFLYEGLKDENKIFYLKDEKSSQNSSVQNDLSNKRSTNLNNNSANNITNQPQLACTNSSSQYLLKIKHENNEESFFNYKNFINQMRLSEFYL